MLYYLALRGRIMKYKRFLVYLSKDRGDQMRLPNKKKEITRDAWRRELVEQKVMTEKREAWVVVQKVTTEKREATRSLLGKILSRESGFDGEWELEIIENIEDIGKNH